jgi:hypothetical protein
LIYNSIQRISPCLFSAMKSFSTRFLARALAPACIILLGASCAKNNDEPAPVVATTEMSWTADNTNYISTTATATAQGTNVMLDGNATSASGRYNVALSVPAMVGTYSTAGASNAVNYSMYYFTTIGTTSALYMAANAGNIGAGTVTITTFSATNVIGTFSFTGSTLASGLDKVVTNGKFSIKR